MCYHSAPTTLCLIILSTAPALTPATAQTSLDNDIDVLSYSSTLNGSCDAGGIVTVIATARNVSGGSLGPVRAFISNLGPHRLVSLELGDDTLVRDQVFDITAQIELASCCPLDFALSFDSSVCGDTSIQSNFSPDDDNYHIYPEEPLTTTICTKDNSNCTRDYVFSLMLSRKFFVAPTISPFPVRHCERVLLNGVSGLNPVNPIRTFVNPSNYEVINYTTSLLIFDHIFHPGYVSRRILEDEERVYVSTTGEGTGDFKDINNAIGPGIFKSLDLVLKSAFDLAN